MSTHAHANHTMQRYMHTPVGRTLIRLLIVGLLFQGWPLWPTRLSAAAPAVVSPAQIDGCPTDIVPGDIDGQNGITSEDALLVLRHFIGLTSLDACQQERANIHAISRNAITPADALCIFSASLNLTSCLDLQPPVLAAIGNRAVALGTSLSLRLVATDPNGDRLNFSATPLPLPAGASLNAQSGLFTFTPIADQVGDINLTFGVSDGTLINEESVIITVEGTATGGVTALTGRLLDTSDFVDDKETPVVGATVSLMDTGVSATSDADGAFMLTGVPAGSQILDIDTSGANPAPDGSPYSGFREAIALIEGVTNVVERPFLLPRIATESLTTIAPDAMATVTNANLGAILEVPPNTAKNPDGTDFTGELSISEVPESMAPVALPDELQFGQLVTIQPVGVTFDTPLALTMANIDNLPPGSELDLWSLDPNTGTFAIVGTGRVSDDGTVIETIEGGVNSASWHGFLALLLELLNDPDPANRDLARCILCNTGSQTHVNSGNLVVDHTLASYRALNVSRAVRLVYNSLNADPQLVLSSSPTISVRAAVPLTVSVRVSVAGVDQGAEIFTDTSGLSENRDETIHQVVQFDASALATGIYPSRLTLTSNYRTSSVSSVVEDFVLVNNQRLSPFGAGWSLDGLQQLSFGLADKIVVTEGSGSIKAFTDPSPEVAGAKTFAAPPGEFSTLDRNADDTYTRTLTDGTQIQFDAAGFHTATVDRNGNATTYTYDDTNRLTTITDPANLVTMVTYTDTHLASLIDPAGRTTTFSHNEAGDLIQVTDPDTSTRQFAYDARHRMTSQTSKRDFVTTYTYSFSGRNIQTTLPDGSTRQVSPSETIGLIDLTSGLGARANPAPVMRLGEVSASFIDGNNGATTYATDRFGSTTNTIDQLGRQTAITRNTNGDPVSILNPNGAVTNLTYDDRGNLLAQQEAADAAVERVTSFVYEPTFNQVTESTDLAGNVTTIAYDARGNPTNVTLPLGGVRTMTYDSRGLPLTLSDENGNTTTLTYDANGNSASMTNAVGTVATLTRDAAGNVTSVIEAAGSQEERISRFTYDALNRLLTSTNATGATTTFSYDARGNIVMMESPTGEITTQEYDAINRVMRIEDPLRGTRQVTYDANGNLVTMLDGRMQTTSFEYDAANQLVRSIDPLDGQQHFGYDAQGNVISLTDARGRTTSFAFDILNRRLRQTNPLGLNTTFTYDARDNLIAHTDPKGQFTTYSYDELSRLTQILTPDNTITVTYDAVGNLTSIQDNDSGFTLGYDGLNRRVDVVTLDLDHQPAVTLTSTYNVVGNRIQLSDSAGNTTQFAYDGADRLTQLITPLGSAINQSYDPTGQLTQIMFPNTVASDYTYNAQGRLTNLTHTVGADTLLASFGYTYDGMGDILSIAEPGATAGSTGTLAMSFQYDAANRIREDDRFTYTYDANGNLATKIAQADGAVTTYRFDAQNHLVEIASPDGTTVNYRYDPLGRRIEKDINGTITRYVYDGFDILLEYDGSNTLMARYTHGDEIDQPLSMSRGGQSFFFQADHLGSVRKLTDASGAIVNTYTYDTYGRVENTREDIPNPFTYTGREQDAESGLYYYRARYYDPQIGQFISEDPIGFSSGDLNLFRYARGNPITFKDPLGTCIFGLDTIVCIVAALAVVAIGATEAVEWNSKRELLEAENQIAQETLQRLVRGEITVSPQVAAQITAAARQAGVNCASQAAELVKVVPGSTANFPVTSGVDVGVDLVKKGGSAVVGD